MESWTNVLDRLVRDRGPALTSYATMLCGDRWEAEDIVQDAVVKVFSRLRGTRALADDKAALGDAGRLEAYTRRAILTVYLDRYRHRRLWPRVLRLSARLDHVPDPSDSGTTRGDVARALQQLTPRQRACVVLRYFDDLTVTKIAALGLAEGTVKRHLHDGAATLRSLLADAETPAVVSAAGLSSDPRQPENGPLDTKTAKEDPR